jgi:hypothetical protein
MPSLVTATGKGLADQKNMEKTEHTYKKEQKTDEKN